MENTVKDKKLFSYGQLGGSTLSAMPGIGLTRVLCLSWYLDSHYDMSPGAMRNVCLPVGQGKSPKLGNEGAGADLQVKFPALPFFLTWFSIGFPFNIKNYWPLSPLLLSGLSVLRIADKRNCANEPLKPLNGRGLCTMGQRMQRWTKAGPCPATLPCSDGSERTHERG